MLDQGNTAFVLIMAALVLFMTPGLAFFYGGLVKAKSVISMMMMSFGAIALVGVLWVLYGYAIAFANHGEGTNVAGIVGFFSIDWNQIGLGQAFEEAKASTINAAYPSMAFVGFQATFAIITVALISGAIADRAKFGAWMIFAGVWVTVVYFPVASWVFNLTSGMFAIWGVIDFAGGTAVHINAGAAGLALALVLGKRVGFAKGAHKPHNPPFVLLGAAILWFGWFGFNAGSEGAADGIASLAWVNTLAAPAAAILGWLLIEKLKDGKATSVGAASGAVAGLVAITPACAALTPAGASCSASSPVWSAASRSTGSTVSASTTRSTSWASTWSAVSSARSTSASSPTPPASSTRAPSRSSASRPSPPESSWSTRSSWPS